MQSRYITGFQRC